MEKTVKKKNNKSKKKGRPSLIDLQKRSLKKTNGKLNCTLEHPQNSQPTLRRSTRRNPIPSDEESEELSGDTQRQSEKKKIKLVVESNAETSTVKKRKIKDSLHGSDGVDAVKGEVSNSGENSQQGDPVESEQSTQLPDKTLLLIILQRLQKLDKYGVFSEPVDPEELPDYHDIIEHPMDFSTVRKKLDGGIYANLDQFEKDVFLICSNAMQYNASDTVYFRQARSIQDLARKSFENLRQDSDDNEAEKKTARRGRPPTYCVKKTPGKPVMEHLISEANSSAMLAAGAESRIFFHNEIRKGSLGDKTYSNEGHRGCMTENKWDRTDGFSGSPWKGQFEKYGKKLNFGDEDRRSTYLHPQPYISRPDSTLVGERKQLVPVGHFSGHGYARSLALFAASMGPIAWICASKKIEKSLPAGIKFGPGWVGDHDANHPRTSVLIGQLSGSLSSLKHFVVAGSSLSVAETSIAERKEEPAEKLDGNNSGMSKESQKVNLFGNQVPSTGTVDNNSSTCVSESVTPSSSLADTRGALESTTVKAEAAGLNTSSPFNSDNRSVSTSKLNPSFQNNRSPSSHSHLNEINGFNLLPQIDKLPGVSRPFETSLMLGDSPKSNENYVHLAVAKISDPENTRSTEITQFQSSTPQKNSQLGQLAARFCSKTSSESMSKQGSNRGLQPLGPDSVPPDLNVRFQSPASPSSCNVDPVHPDLALQL